jgi:hypothetical protein
MIFLVGFFLFIALYIILRLLAEKQEHKFHPHQNEGKKDGGKNENK